MHGMANDVPPLRLWSGQTLRCARLCLVSMMLRVGQGLRMASTTVLDTRVPEMPTSVRQPVPMLSGPGEENVKHRWFLSSRHQLPSAVKGCSRLLKDGNHDMASSVDVTSSAPVGAPPPKNCICISR